MTALDPSRYSTQDYGTDTPRYVAQVLHSWVWDTPRCMVQAHTSAIKALHSHVKACGTGRFSGNVVKVFRYVIQKLRSVVQVLGRLSGVQYKYSGI